MAVALRNPAYWVNSERTSQPDSEGHYIITAIGGSTSARQSRIYLIVKKCPASPVSDVQVCSSGGEKRRNGGGFSFAARFSPPGNCTKPEWNNGAGRDLARWKYTATFSTPLRESHPGASRDRENRTSHQWSCLKQRPGRKRWFGCPRGSCGEDGAKIIAMEHSRGRTSQGSVNRK